MEEHSVTLSDDLTLEKFKSFLLTLTDNKKFFLEHLLNNNQTLGELKALSKDQIVQVKTAKDSFHLNMTSTDGTKFDKAKKEKFSENTKVKYLIDYLQDDNKIDEKADRFKITFEDGTDAMSYLRTSSEKLLKFVNRNDPNFDKKNVTLGQLGINRYSKLIVSKEKNTNKDAMAECLLKLNHNQYIEFNA